MGGEMKRPRCDRCGGPIRLSPELNAYVCASGDMEHALDRTAFEQRWVEPAEGAARAAGAGIEVLRELAAAHASLGELAVQAGDSFAAQQRARCEVEALERAAQAAPADAGVREGLVAALSNLAQLAEENLDRSSCLAAYQRMLVLAEAMHAAAPTDVARGRCLSLCHNGLGRAMRALGRAGEAAEHFGRDVALLSDLVARSPHDDALKLDLAAAHFNLYLALEDSVPEAEQLRAALATFESMSPAGRESALARQIAQRATEALEGLGRASTPPKSRGEAGGSQGRADGAGAARSASSRAALVADVQRALARRYPTGGAAS
jgi:tetratricopeptide (TPR) repeat protein